MSTPRRLLLSFLFILVLFVLNLSIHLWSGRERGASVEALGQIALRQAVLGSLKRRVGEISPGWRDLANSLLSDGARG